MLEMLSAPSHVQYSQVCPLGGHVRQAEKPHPKTKLQKEIQALPVPVVLQDTNERSRNN